MKQAIKDGLIWGILLWVCGYILGIIAFMLVPPAYVGWLVMPLGILITLWVLSKRIKAKTMQAYLIVAIIWTAIAIALDYIFIVRLLKPADGYYKLDVYLYYVLTFVLPLAVGWKNRLKSIA